MNIYDYIIVGGGIAGLYANYKLSKNKKIIYYYLKLRKILAGERMK